MKKLTVLIATVLLSVTVMAQEKALLDGNMHNGGYGAFFTRVGMINGQSEVIMGGQGAWIINHKLALGGKGYALISTSDISALNNIKMEFGCWGGLIEYIVKSDNLIHLTVNIVRYNYT